MAQNAWFNDRAGHVAAAEKGWKRKKAKSAKRSRAAKKAWETRRAGKPKKRRRKAANPVHSRRRHYGRRSRNPVLPGISYNPVLPYMAYNPGIQDFTASFQRLIAGDFWMNEVIPLTGGFFGTAFIAKQINRVPFFAEAEAKAQRARADAIAAGTTGFAAVNWMGHLVDFGSTAILGGVTAMVAKPQTASRVFAGGVVYSFMKVLRGILPPTFIEQVGLAGFGNNAGANLATDLKQRIAAAVRRQAAATSPHNMGAFLTAQSLETAAPVLSGMQDFVTAQALETGSTYLGGGSNVASLDDVMSDVSL